jgi:hypothetical protein
LNTSVPQEIELGDSYIPREDFGAFNNTGIPEEESLKQNFLNRLEVLEHYKRPATQGAKIP